jgi:chitin disaccharide deacetylase
MASLKRVVFHQDDVGMCHGANVAFLELSRLGVVTCGSVMVPCPWFSELAEAAAADPTLDVGVHLTLTAEKRHYRWGPISGPAPSAGLVDPSGYFWRDVRSVRRHAQPEAVEIELRAQIDRALAAGIDVSHLDAHMGSTLAPELCAIYVRLGAAYQVPILLTATLAGYSPNNHLEGMTESEYAPFVAMARAQGQPIFDAVLETPFERPVTETAVPVYRKLFERVPEGLSFLALHPNAPGEVEVIEPDSAHIRTDEYRLFQSDDFRAWLSERDSEFIGMRSLRDSLRATA